MIIDINLGRWKQGTVSVDKLKLYNTTYLSVHRTMKLYTLLKRLREELGIQAPNIYTLLGYDSPVEFPNWRELICEEVGHFIERTERFKETKEQIIASQ